MGLFSSIGSSFVSSLFPLHPARAPTTSYHACMAVWVSYYISSYMYIYRKMGRRLRSLRAARRLFGRDPLPRKAFPLGFEPFFGPRRPRTANKRPKDGPRPPTKSQERPKTANKGLESDPRPPPEAPRAAPDRQHRPKSGPRPHPQRPVNFTTNHQSKI